MLGLRHYKKTAIDLFQGDLTEFVCDAMVTAANEQLAEGGGVDGAIRRVGGPSVADECRNIGHCPVGQAVVTKAGHLPAKGLIHCVGPVWRGGQSGEADHLRSAYERSLSLALQNHWAHIAFPSVSTGAFAFPVREAAELALTTIKHYLDRIENSSRPRRISFVLFDRDTYQAYQKALFQIFPELEEAGP